MISSPRKVALIGNPNSGKTSLFNQLTGRHQHTSNYPGTTVNINVGKYELENGSTIDLIDFPGAYSFFATSADEKLNVEILIDEQSPHHPDLVLYIADVTQLDRHFLLASQVIDLGIPTVIILNMFDLIEPEKYDLKKVEKLFGVRVIPVSTRSGLNISTIIDTISSFYTNGSEDFVNDELLYKFDTVELSTINNTKQIINSDNPYLAKLISHHYKWLPFINNEQKANIESGNKETGFEDVHYQIKETMNRYQTIEPVLKSVYNYKESSNKLTDKIDNIITHRVLGPIIFFSVMLFIFQAIFSWATIPSDWVESGFSAISSLARHTMGAGWFTNLIVEGLIPGLAGVFVFLPQIIMLFFFIAILEESGYMSRVVFMFDTLLSKFGLNGRSIVSLISSGACAIPAIMSTRTISNFKERLITIMVAPLISCSARIPVYTALIGFVVPSTMSFMGFNAQGLAFMGLYLLGIVAALGSALVFKFILKNKDASYLLLELPEYKKPMIKNIFYYVSTRVSEFIKEAGKIILIVSMLLWFLASYGPGDAMQQAESQAISISKTKQMSDDQQDNLVASQKIEASYAGILGKFIEPIVKPLGYDWKMGIALITSFAAREVFVGTMATIYSIGSDQEDEIKLRDRMSQQVNPLTGKPIYSFATSLSLLLFYVFALQCLSTLAVTYKETKSIKWPIIQFTYMGTMAYLVSFIVYQYFS